MNARKSILFIVTGDPRTEPRPAEAVRIAAGLGSWGNLQVDLLLKGEAALLLAGDPEELIDGQLIADYLPMVARHGGRVFLEETNPHSGGLCKAAGVEHLDSNGLKKMLEAATCSALF